jgi:intracellular multiplication protein IcmK
MKKTSIIVSRQTKVLACAFASFVAVGIPAANAQSANGQNDSQAPMQLPPLPAPMLDQAVQGAAPMTPDQIRGLVKLLLQEQEAAHPGPAPSLVSPQINASFQPNGGTYTINVAPGFVTSIAFIGADGSPWPVVSMTVGNSSWFAATVPSLTNKEAAKNVMTVGALTSSATSSVSVLLEGAAEPLTFVLRTTPTESDGTVTVRINRPGPDAKEPMLRPSLPAPVTQALYGFLNGVPPDGAQRLQLSVDGVSAWSYQGSIYVRTTYQMMSPAWTNSVQGPDGTMVYEVPQVPLFLVSEDGAIRSVEVKGT